MYQLILSALFGGAMVGSVHLRGRLQIEDAVAPLTWNRIT
jgi:hypothetical protein